MENQSKKPARIAFRIKEVAEMTGVPASTIRSRVRSGDLAVIQGFGPWLIGKAELDRFMKETAIGGTQEKKDQKK